MCPIDNYAFSRLASKCIVVSFNILLNEECNVLHTVWPFTGKVIFHRGTLLSPPFVALDGGRVHTVVSIITSVTGRLYSSVNSLFVLAALGGSYIYKV